MSTNFVEVVCIDEIKPHPNADKLEIAIIRGTQTIILKDSFAPGELAVFFPPDMLIDPEVAEKLGVQKYLKHSIYNGFKQQCRVAATRLRGEPSFGFIIPIKEALKVTKVQVFHCKRVLAPGEEAVAYRTIPQIGSNVDEWFGAQKYEPPFKFMSEDAERDDERFHKYTSIEHFWRYPNAIEIGTDVRITEKIHGTNSRVGFVQKPDGEFEWMAGSHRVRRKNPALYKAVDEAGNPIPPKKSLYWSPLDSIDLVDMIHAIHNGQHSVIVFGEIYGGSVQDMDYGTPGATGYRVFDISIDGKYADWQQVKTFCDTFQIETVPLLYEGPFFADVVKEHTYGPTTLAEAGEIKSQFKAREGCVITTLAETFYAPTGGRLILKSVSADYLDRKGAKDNDELPNESTEEVSLG